MQITTKDFLQNVHQQWIDESDKGTFDLKYLKLPENVKEAIIISAFPLTDQQLDDLKKKLKKRIGTDIAVKATVDASLIAGFVMTIGSVVVDASLKYKIQKSMQD